MKKLKLLVFITCIFCDSCSIPKNGCPANIYKHDRRPFRAAIDTGQCVQVLCFARPLHYFQKDNGEIFFRNMRGKILIVGESYMFTNHLYNK